MYKRGAIEREQERLRRNAQLYIAKQKLIKNKGKPMNLSDEQNAAYGKIRSWLKNPFQKRFVLAGYAGTGKSTLAGVLSEELGNVRFCAYTGKAANVLRNKGCSADTVHGSIYKLVDEDRNGKPIFKLDLDSDIRKASCVIVDEFSMLPKEIIDDLEYLAKKVLYLGDPFQLPPVSGKCSLEPDLVLTQVHRQALDSPILRAATDVREGRGLGFCDWGDFVYKPRRETMSDEFIKADQVIVGYNKTRQSWNQRFREIHGFSGVLPKKGEKLICLRNNREIGLFNGMIENASDDSRRLDEQTCEINFGRFYNLEAYSGYFTGNKLPERQSKEVQHFDFSYVITAHKSQGSEFDNVVVFNEPIGRGEERQRWQYTALTRASKKCVLVEP